MDVAAALVVRAVLARNRQCATATKADDLHLITNLFVIKYAKQGMK